MKRFKSLFLALILTLALVVGLTACNPTGATTKTLTFDMNGHGTQVQAQKLATEEFPEVPEDPTEEGWIFKGWYIDEDFSDYYYFDPIYEDTIVYAKWAQAYIVSFNTGVSGVTVPSQTVEIGDKIDLPTTPTAPGKKFEGWYTDSTFASEFNANTPITGNLTLHAKWSTYFKVTFDKNGRGSQSRVPEPQEYEVAGSKAVEPEDMSVNGYKFLGWSTTSDGSSGIYDFDTVLTDSITLYAQWVRIFKVSFDLNHEEAIQLPPDAQSVDEGKYAERPAIDPTLSGFRFVGWYVDAECSEEFDFDSMPITKATTIYAKWEEDKVPTLDVGELPEYSHRGEAAFGERPDLDGYVIDGKMGEAENWEDQNWYVNAITEAPTIQMKTTTQFSDKGLYMFISVEDNGGLYMAGQNWYFKNSNLLFRITNGTVINEYRMDTLTLYPSYNTVKIAVNIAEGEVNTTNTENKRAVMNVELFATWDDLHFGSRLNSVKVYAVYNYKRIASDNIKYTLATPFVNTSAVTMADYVDYNASGYVNADVDGAVLGASSMGIAKTNGWDISHESDEKDAYVSSNGASTQAIFYKNVVDTNYYKFAFEVDASSAGGIGKAGAIIYNNASNYAMIVFDVDDETYDYTAKKFKKAKPYLAVTDKNGKMSIRALAEYENLVDGKLEVEIIFSNGYVYCIIGEVLIHCEFISDLNARTNPGLCTLSGGAGVRFRNYTAQVLTIDEARAETAKYAYVISKGRLSNLTIDLSTTAVSSKDGESKTVVMTMKNTPVNINENQKRRIMEERVIDERIRIYQINSFVFTVNGEAQDATDVLDAGLRYGEYVCQYPYKGDSVISNTSSVIPTENLTAIVGRVVDLHTGNPVGGTVTILSDNPRLSNYDMPITNGDVVLVVPKGFNYRIIISQAGYRKSTVEIGKVDDYFVMSEVVKLVPNILGGTAVSKKTGESYTSTLTGWDMTNETNGEIVFETNGANPSAVYFSGYTVHTYQYLKLSVSNVTDVVANPTYEKDPSIGFTFVTPTKSAYMGLRAQGLRFRPNLDSWNPKDVNTYGKNTCNHFDVSGKHKDTIEVIRISRNLYTYINGTYMGCYVMDKELAGEVAVAVSGTFTYYSKIIYRDYEIKVGDEALEIAKERVGVDFTLDESLYDINTDTWEVDFSKPYVDVNLTKVERDDGSYEDMLFAGSEVEVSLTEYAQEGMIYIVEVGSYGVMTLSSQSPTSKITLPETVSGEVIITASSKSSSTITGQFVSDEVSGPYNAYAQMSDGSIIKFVTGDDGTFSVVLPASTTFTIAIDTEGCIAESIMSKSAGVGKEKDVGVLRVYKPTLGGKIPGVDKFTSSVGGYKLFYDNVDETVYEGETVEVECVGNHYVAINRGMFEDFDISFSFIRYKYDDRTNESDPGVAVVIAGAEGYESMIFHADGVRNLPMGATWNDRVEVKQIMKYDTRTSFNVKVDFRVVRRGNIYLQYYKLANDADWNLIHVQEGKVKGTAGVFLGTTNSTNNHYAFWNVKSSVPSAETLNSLVAPVTVNVTSGDSSGTVSVSGGTEIDGVVKQVIGDTLVLDLKPAKGNVLALVKVDGKRVEVASNKMSLLITKEGMTVDVMFEPEFESRTVSGKIALPTYKSGLTLPSKVNFIAFLQDGRQYECNDVAVANDGSVSFRLRDGAFKITAYCDTLSSTPKEFTVSENSTNFGTITLDVMRVGDVTVNGIQVKNDAIPNEELLFSDGMTIMPIRRQTTLWMTDAVVKGDFVAQTTMIQSKDPSDPWYTTDDVTGFQLSNGTSTLSIMFLEAGFRVHAKGYSPNEETCPMLSSNVHYFGNKLNATTDTINTLGLKRVGKDLIVYANGVKFMTINSTSGITLHIQGYKKIDGTTNEAHVKACATALLDNVNQEIAIGYRCNINMGNTAVYFNQTGFYNTIISDSASVVSSYNGNMTK